MLMICIIEQGGDWGVEGTIEKWICEERSWKGKENSMYGDQKG